MKKIIGYAPLSSVDNAYVGRTIEMLSTFAEVREVPSLREFLKSPSSYRRHCYDFIVLNWIENGIVKRDGTLSAKGLIAFVIHILIIKTLARKVIFVRHNNYPHNASACSGKWAANFIDAAEKLFDGVVTHSGHHRSRRRHYIPHPLYRIPEVASSGPAGEGGYFFVFGRILPYKKIDELIAGVSSDVRLVIAGSSPDDEYIQKLRCLSQGKSVQLITKYIDDGEAARLARASRGIVITHNDEDMVVSGTFFYALSVGVPIITVSSPFVEWFQKEYRLPGVTVGSNISSVCELLSKEQAGDTCARGPEKRVVEELFGDDVVKRGWRDLLGLNHKYR